MAKPEQLAMFDLPEVLPPARPEPKPPAERKPRPKRPRRMPLAVKLYTVRTSTAEYQVQAATHSEAKYAAFRLVQQTGQYCYSGGFIAFASGGVSVKELRA
jgi:hypothetical protein